MLRWTGWLPGWASRFRGSGSYWEKRYRSGGTSGEGSYGRLAAFKAEVLNAFVQRHGIHHVLELGCGDGNQLSFAEYRDYTGLDIAPEAVRRCRERYAGDQNKRFLMYDPASYEPGQTTGRADLALSLDVIFHLVEDEVFDAYMRHLFASSHRFVGIYSSNFDAPGGPKAPHVRHRRFADWIATHRPESVLIEHIPNRYPRSLADGGEVSFADFFFYDERREEDGRLSPGEASSDRSKSPFESSAS
ncbi:MAG: class I SAM-dependent methyltransferase [Myxococcales bacterium]|nr:class I SAM-dependent methyltransferase [Myxococcales bacterium]